MTGFESSCPGPSAVALAEADAVAAAMVRLATLVPDAARWPAEDRRRVLERLDRAVDGLAAARAAVLVAERESGAWRGAGDRSFEAWRGRTCRVGERSAAAQVRQAEQLGAVPSAAAAVTDGRISLDHAVIIARVAGSGTAAQRDAARTADAQHHLVELAERQDAGTFATTVARWAASLDPAALERDHEAQRAARYLHLADTPRGTVLKGLLDSMSGHRLTLALEALSPRPAVDDDRDPGQRRADALAAMSGKVLALADTKPGGHVPPQISMILTEDTWLAARSERERHRRCHDGRPGADGLVTDGPVTDGPVTDGPATDGAVTDGRVTDGGTARVGVDGVSAPATVAEPPSVREVIEGGRYVPATLEDGTPVPTSVLAAAMCDCELTRIVIDAEGVPLDLGRAERVFTGSQRRAVIARDRECAWPECHAPARWCEIHHIRWWERDDGPTSVANGVLLCGFHHHEVHRRDLTIGRLVGGVPGGSRRGGARSAVRGPAEDLPRARYVFRDRAGRAVGEGAGASQDLGGAGTRGGTRVRADRATGGATGIRPVMTAGRTPPVPTVSSGSLPPPNVATGAPCPEPSELDLTWTTDPMTGMRVPAFFADG